MEILIKRYRNRKMYDSNRKQYINFSDIEQMIRDNQPIKVIDNVTGEDITRQILLQLIIRAEPRQGDSKVPLEGLRNLLQNNENPIFNAFRNALNIGRDVVQQISTRSTSDDEQRDNHARLLPNVVDMAKHMIERVSDSTVKIINGTLAREMLRVPKRDDWTRIETKLEQLEKKLMSLKHEDTGGTDDAKQADQ